MHYVDPSSWVDINYCNGQYWEDDMSVSYQVSPSRQPVMAHGGQRDGGAAGHDKDKRVLRPRTYIQKPSDHYINNKTTVKGTDAHVTWFLHNGRTQMHIAKTDFRQADFDVVILPIKQDRTGINVFSAEQSTRNYGTLFSREPFPRDEFMTVDIIPKPSGFVCKVITAGMFSDRVNASDLIHDMVTFNISKTKKKKAQTRTMGIPIQFDGLYDPLLFVHSIMKIRHADNDKPFSCFFCCKDEIHEPNLMPFMASVNAVLEVSEMPRRYISRAFTNAFCASKVSTTIVPKGILDAKCECIVAAIGNDLRLDKGKLTQAIVNAAGSELQKDIDGITGRKQNYQSRDILHCGSRKLNERGVKSILFGHLPKWIPGNNNMDQTLVAKFVQECLLVADDNRRRSVAFPVLGSGYLNYPKDIIVLSILDGIDMYASSGMHGYVSEVVIACIDGENTPLYKKFETEICRRLSMKDGSETTAKPEPQRNDLINVMSNDEFEPKFETEICRRLSMKDGSETTAKPEPQRNDLINVMANDEFEPLYDEVTAEVNPGLTKYLIDNNQLERFKAFLSNQFGVQVGSIDGGWVLKGTWTNISKTEDYLDNSSVTGSLFNDAVVIVNTLNESIMEKVDAPIQNAKGENVEPVTAETEDTSSSSEEHQQPVVNETSKTLYVPAGIGQTSFILPDCNRTVSVFKTNDIFSFETDIKIVTTDKTFSHQNQYLSHVLDRIPNCEGKWDTETRKPHNERHMELIALDERNTCDYIIMTVIPHVTEPIQKKEKQRFKDNIYSLTRGILEKAGDMEVQSVTLPILVHTGVGAANDMCCQTMSLCILDYLRVNSTLKHINVIFDSDECRKMFCAAFKQKLHSK